MFNYCNNNENIKIFAKTNILAFPFWRRCWDEIAEDPNMTTEKRNAKIKFVFPNIFIFLHQIFLSKGNIFRRPSAGEGENRADIRKNVIKNYVTQR